MNMKLIGQGRTAQIFDYADGKIVKLFFEGKPEYDAQKEFQNLQIVNEADVPSPKVYEKVCIDGRFGIVEEKLSGKDGFEILFTSENPTSFIKDMADLQKTLNSFENENCISYKDSLKASLWSVKDEDEKSRICKKIDALPNGNNLCHGDFHPGNIQVLDSGKQILIDFVNLCRGPKLFDVARTYFLLSKGELPEEMSKEERIAFTNKRNQLAKTYLTFMEISEESLATFIDVISEVRKYELN